MPYRAIWVHTVVRSGLEVNRLALLFGKQPVVRAKPRAILGVCARVIRQATEADISPNRSEIPARRMDDLEHAVVVRQLYPRHHQDPAIPRLPIIITYQRALRRRALVLCDARHPEADVRRRVERRGVKNGYAVPARLHLDGEVLHEALLRGSVLEDGLEGRVLERGAVDVARNPVIVEHGRALCRFVISLGTMGSSTERKGRDDIRAPRGTCSPLHK